MTPNDAITSTDIEVENWAALERYPAAQCTCVNGHTFWSKAKFSGRLIALVSKQACPKCGTYELQRISDAGEQQTITSKDVGSIQ